MSSPEWYRQYLQSDHWQDVKRRYRASKFKWECGCCGATDKPLDLHHKTYKRLGHEYLWDLLPLCRDCHDVVHRIVQRRGGKGLWAAARLYRKKINKPKKKQSKGKRLGHDGSKYLAQRGAPVATDSKKTRKKERERRRDQLEARYEEQRRARRAKREAA